MSENERKSISLKVALFLDDQLGRLSSLGHQVESIWCSFSSHWDMEAIGECLSRCNSKIGWLLGTFFFPFWIVLNWLIQTCLSGWNRLAQHSVLHPVIWLVSVSVGRLLVALSSFLIELLRSRPLLLRPLTVLPILLLVPTAIIGFEILPLNETELGKTYRQAIQQEIDRGNMDRVLLYQAKLEQLGIPYGHPEMQAVNQLLEQRHGAEAFRLAEQLAPIHRPGLPAAHLFLALACLRGESGLASAQAQALEAKHLEHLKSISEKFADNKTNLPLELRYLDGLLMLQQNQTAAAMEAFENLSAHYWPASAMSLEINFKLGRERESRIASQELLRWTRLQPAILRELPPACYAIWYQTEKLSEFCPANAATSSLTRLFIAEQWQRQYPSNPRAAETCIVEFGHAIESLACQSQTEQRRAASMLISLAGMLGSHNRDRLASWLIPRISETQSETELFAVVKFAQQSNPPAVLLEIMGTAAIAEGKHDLALDLLSRAVALDPDNGVAWNNLAVVAKRDRAIRFAFDAAQQAVRLEPNNGAMRLTRGMIAIDMKHWETVQVDFEWVLQNQPDNPEVHRYLAIAYEHLGKPDKASFHQLLAGN